jgi:hypothetical protein
MAVGNRSKPAPVGSKPKAAEDDDFLAGGAERDIAEAWIPEVAGESLIGRVTRFSRIRTKLSKGPDDLAPLAEFGPVVIRDASGQLHAFASLALVLGASLRLRLSEGDLGKVFAVRYNGMVDAKGGKMHDYTVVEQSADKLHGMIAKAGASSDDLPF